MSYIKTDRHGWVNTDHINYITHTTGFEVEGNEVPACRVHLSDGSSHVILTARKQLVLEIQGTGPLDTDIDVLLK